MASMDRPDLYVVARILDRLWQSPEPMLRTHLQVAANVNYDIFARYLDWMRERNLVELEDSADGHVRVRLAPAGRPPGRSSRSSPAPPVKVWMFTNVVAPAVVAMLPASPPVSVHVALPTEIRLFAPAPPSIAVAPSKRPLSSIVKVSTWSPPNTADTPL